MHRWCCHVVGFLLSSLVVIGCAPAGPGPGERPGATAGARAEDGVPVFELDPAWPTPLSDREKSWPDLARNAMSIAVGARDHVWILQRPTAADRESEVAGQTTVPRVFEFDAAGNLVHAWGGPGTSQTWMEGMDPTPPYPAGTPAEHGMFVDHQDNVWVTGNGHVALKFSRQGELLLQIGELWQNNGSNDPELLGNSCELTVDLDTNEVYIADGYINRRVVVYDADTGAYKRHWGAYGNRPVDFQLLDSGLYADPEELYDPSGPPQQQFLAVHCVRIANDGLVYVCDRQRNRVQVFHKDGTYVTEVSVAKDAPAEFGFPAGVGAVNFGTASTVGFSTDPEQRYLYVGDNLNAKIWIFRRRDLQELGSIDTDPSANHYLTVDSAGNIYNSGLQKFVITSVAPG